VHAFFFSAQSNQSLCSILLVLAVSENLLPFPSTSPKSQNESRIVLLHEAQWTLSLSLSLSTPAAAVTEVELQCSFTSRRQNEGGEKKKKKKKINLLQCFRSHTD
jgi:hypothetical protein